MFQNETPWLRNALFWWTCKNVCCNSLTGAVSGQAERHKAAAKESMHNKTVRTLELCASYDITEHHRNFLVTIPVTARSNARCTIMQNSHQTALFLLAPALLILGLPLLFFSFRAAASWRLDVRLPDKWGKPNFSQGPWRSRGRDGFPSERVVFACNHPHMIRPGVDFQMVSLYIHDFKILYFSVISTCSKV